MTREAIREAVLKALTSVAPEIDPSSIDPHGEFRQEFDLDSMDFLNFVIGLHASLHVDVPEADYYKLATLDGAIDYVATRLNAS